MLNHVSTSPSTSVICRECGARPTAFTPLVLRETSDGFGAPAYIVQCESRELCASRRRAQESRRERQLVSA